LGLKGRRGVFYILRKTSLLTIVRSRYHVFILCRDLERGRLGLDDGGGSRSLAMTVSIIIMMSAGEPAPGPLMGRRRWDSESDTDVITDPSHHVTTQ
jgi:hypothetical protein